jgi:hypothetical protein
MKTVAKAALVWLGLMVGGFPAAQAEDLLLKDGNLIRGVGIRREGQFLFAKPEAGQEQIVPLANVARITFRESQGLRDARLAFKDGESRSIISNTGSELTYHRIWVDMPGSVWLPIMELRVPALAAAGRPDDVAELIREWVATGNPDLDTAVALMKLKESKAPKEELMKAYTAATAGNPSTLTAAIAWLELGNLALEARDWAAAIRNFVSVQVFAPKWRPLHPSAMLGCVKACVGNEQPDHAVPFLEDLKNEFPKSSQSRIAPTLVR